MLKKIINFIGIFLIIVSILIFAEKVVINLVNNKDKEEKIEIFFKEYNNDGFKIIKENYLMVLEIPTINLKEGIYSFDSKKNTIEENVAILEYSSLPDNDDSILLLAAHSGNANNAYFKNLNKLNYDDIINIYYNKNLYEYKIINIYTINKSDGFSLNQYDKKALILITCFDNYQYLIIESLIL